MSFNQDGTCICVADFRGVRIFNVQSQEPVFSLDIGAIRCVAWFCSCAWGSPLDSGVCIVVGLTAKPHRACRSLTLWLISLYYQAQLRYKAQDVCST